jgi:outer membrane lipoprotein SlyB
MNNRIHSLALAGLLALTGIGLSFGASAQNYRDDRGYDNRREICNYCGTVRSISQVNRRGKGNTGATVLGAVIGGALGNQVGKGDGRKAATVVGAVAGGAIANNATKDNHRRTYFRIAVRMDDGRIRNFDQSNTYGLRPGSRVEVHNGNVHRSN